MRIDNSLKDALAWRFVVVAILPLLIVSILSLNYFAREIEQRLIRENSSVATSLAAQISLELQKPATIINEVTRLYTQLLPTEQNYSSLLDDLVISVANIESILLLDKNGIVVAAGLPADLRRETGGFVGRDMSLLPQFKSAREATTGKWSRAFSTDLTGQISLALTCAYPDYYAIGYVSIDILQQQFTSLLQKNKSQLLLFSLTGDLILQAPQDKLIASADLELQPLAKAVLAGDVSSHQYEFGGLEFFGTLVKVPKIDWILLYSQEQTGLSSVVWQFRIFFSAVLLLAVLLACIWARLLAKKIVRPISDMARSAKSFAEGDYQYPLPYGNHQEIDNLSDSFRMMRRSIDEREKLLVKNREYFSRLFNGVADAILISKRLPSGRPGRFIEVNDVACQLLGYTREQLLKLSPYDLNRLSHDDPDGFSLILEEIASQESTLFKTEFRCSDNSWVPVEIGCQLFELDGHDVFFSVARDITIREKYESSIKTLARSTVGLTGQECLNEIVQNLCEWLNADGASIGIAADERLKIQASCLAGELKKPFNLQLAGTPYEEIMAGHYRFYQEDTANTFPALKQFNLSRIRSFIGIPMLGHNGQVFGVVSAFSRKPIPAVPHVEELLSVIAARAAAECERLGYEKELANSEEMLRTLFNSTAEAIVGIDLNGDCIFCNPSTLRILGYAEENDLIGKNFCQLVSTDQLKELADSDCPFLAAVQKEDKITGTEGVLSGRNGREIPVEYWGHQMMRDGEFVGGVITFIDISRRRTLEKQLQHSQRMEAIGTLTGGIAHDFNNILTVISGYAGLLQSLYTNDQKLQQKINKIAEAAERGSKLTHGLLAYSRKKSGPSTALDLNQLVLRVQDLFGKVIGERIQKQLSLSDKQLIVLGESSQLEQVLVNLATNARDAMLDGGTLTIATTKTEIDQDFCRVYGYGEPGEYALISVTDTGVGMSKEIQQKIFDPFYTTKDTGKGTGLGLAIAWGIVKQHKGYILVESTPGNGSNFKIYLPLTSHKPLPQTNNSQEDLPGGKEHILLVEDDPQVLDTTSDILTAVGYQVKSCNSAEEALTILAAEEGSLDLILSDVVMPGMKGTEFYQEIRKMTDIPVIFISGYPFDSLRDQGLVEDGFILLNKPIPPHELLSKVREVIA